MFFLFYLMLGLPAYSAVELPDMPPNPCYEGCNSKMDYIWQEYLDNPHAPAEENTFFSGECWYQSRSLNPDTTHYAAFLWDQREDQSRFFATEFGFFYEQNPWQDWNLERARKDMSSAWKKLNTLQVSGEGAKAYVLNDDKQIVYAYWMRQNPASKKLYFISYWIGFMHAFCELSPHQ